jgi:aconitate hydratase
MNTFGSQSELKAGGKTWQIFRISVLEQQRGISLARLPFSLRILLENLLRYEDGKASPPTTSNSSRNGTPKPSPPAKSRGCPPASSCRISLASPLSSTSPPCATP